MFRQKHSCLQIDESESGWSWRWVLLAALASIVVVLSCQLACLPQGADTAASATAPQQSSSVEGTADSSQSSQGAMTDNSMSWLIGIVSVLVAGMLGLIGLAWKMVHSMAKESRESGRQAITDAVARLEHISHRADSASDETQGTIVEIKRLEKDIQISYWIMKASSWMSAADVFKDEEHPLRVHYYSLEDEALDAALKLSPRNGTALIWKAWLRKRAGAIDVALQLVEDALGDSSLHPYELSRAYYNAACYCAVLLEHGQLNKRATAINHLKKAIEGHEFFRTLAAADQDFESLRGSSTFEALIAH